MRQLIGVVLAAGVQVAALNAPFVHAHPEDHDTVHHHGRVVHTHWSEHQGSRSSGPTLSARETDRAVFLNVFVAVAMSVLVVPAIAQDVFVLTAPAERHRHVTLGAIHSHDPPVYRPLGPRAPPSLLS